MRRATAAILIILAALSLFACSRGGAAGDDDLDQARTAYSKGFYLEAEKGYERYLQVEPQGESRKEAWERLSEIAISIKGDLDRAVVLLEAMYLELGTDPEDAWRIMYQLGDVYAQLGNLTKAVESYEKCLVQAGQNVERTCRTQLRMAKLYRAMGNYDLVAVTLTSCAETAQDSESKARCLYELAQSYSFISNWSQSRRALEALLAMPGVSEETRSLSIFLLADIYENERNFGRARELLQSILTSYPNPRVVETRLANLPESEPVEERAGPPPDMDDPPARGVEPTDDEGEGI